MRWLSAAGSKARVRTTICRIFVFTLLMVVFTLFLLMKHVVNDEQGSGIIIIDAAVADNGLNVNDHREDAVGGAEGIGGTLNDDDSAATPIWRPLQLTFWAAWTGLVGLPPTEPSADAADAELAAERMLGVVPERWYLILNLFKMISLSIIESFSATS